MLVIGLIAANARTATFSFENLFIRSTWRYGLTLLETIFDPIIFWGEIGFNISLACIIAAFWIHRVPPGGDQWRIDAKGTRNLFLFSLIITAGILAFMVILLVTTIPEPAVAISTWWPAQASYQAPAIPAIVTIAAIIIAPMKKYKKGSGQGKNIEIATLVVAAVAGISWLISCIPTWWHPRGLYNFNYQLHFIVFNVAFPISIGVFLFTFLLRDPPARGDGKTRVRAEIFYFIGALVLLVIIQVAGIFANGTGAPGQIFDMDVYWWWPMAHVFPYIFIVALACTIITGTRLVKTENAGQFLRGALNRRQVPSIVKKIIIITCIVTFIIPPIVGYATDDEDPPRLLVNQVGYLPASPKRLLFQAPTGKTVPENASFCLVSETSGATVYNGTLWKNSSYYQHWYMEGNFTTFNETGRYHAEASIDGIAVESPPFSIGTGVYDVALERAVDFFYYQRCGYEVEDVVAGFSGHHACHLDDAMIFNGSSLVYKNLTGGWHDAGDYNKYNSWYYTQWRVTRALADAWLDYKTTYSAFQDRYDSNAPDIIDEMLWGATYLLKCIDTVGIKPTTRGLIIHNIHDWNYASNRSAGASYWGPPDRNTDNIPNTGDERIVYTSGNALLVPWGWAGAEEGFGFAGAMLRVARVVEAMNITLPSWAVSVQELRDAAALLNETYFPIAESHEGTKLNGTIWPHMWTAMARLLYEQETARITGNWSVADDWAYMILGHVGDTFDSSNDVHFFSDVLKYYIDCNRTIPAEAFSKISAWQTTFFPLHFVGPFGVFNVFDGEGNPVLFSRDSRAGGGLINADHCWFAWFQALAGHIAPGVRLDLVQNVLDYLFGVNPLGLCQMDGIGGRFVPQIHHRYSYARNPSGRVPGGIINGIRSYLPSIQWAELNGVDQTAAAALLPENAWVDNWPASGLFRDGVSAHSNEIWIIHDGAFLEMLTSFLKYHA
nr:glycoside hydrolase family 9 protein [Candidatus Sigynarchaeota archaeon]